MLRISKAVQGGFALIFLLVMISAVVRGFIKYSPAAIAFTVVCGMVFTAGVILIYGFLKKKTVRLTRKQIDKILEEILLRADEQDEHVTEYVKKLLNVMEYEVPYTSTALMEKLGLKSKETFRKNYMNPAMELQLVQMTIPEKPKSRNQRYVRR